MAWTKVGNIRGATGATGSTGSTGATGPAGVAPTGSLVMFASTTPPTGWLLCDGSAVSKTTYAALFAIIGTSYNTSGEGTGNFRLPNFANAFPRGNTLAASGGADTHAHGPGTLGSTTHTHAGTDHNHTLSSNGQAHVGISTDGKSVFFDLKATNGYTENQRLNSTAASGSGNTGQTRGTVLDGRTDNVNGGPPPVGFSAVNLDEGTSTTENNIPAFVGVSFIIKT